MIVFDVCRTDKFFHNQILTGLDLRTTQAIVERREGSLSPRMLQVMKILIQRFAVGQLSNDE